MLELLLKGQFHAVLYGDKHRQNQLHSEATILNVPNLTFIF